MKLEFKIESTKTIKEFIISNISRNFYGYLKEHNVSYFVNNKTCKPHELLNCGDTLIVLYDEDKYQDGILNDNPLDILYEDEFYIVVDKPAHLQSIPSRGNPNDSVFNRLLYYFKDSNYTVHLINRLDKETRGLVLVAKSNYATAILKEFNKKYIAITDKMMNEECGTINLPIFKVDGSIKREINELGQTAITNYKLISKEKYYIYEIKLKTGRTHQIRLHFSYLGSPLINDTLYGGFLDGNELGLICKEITFYHPILNKKIVIKSKY